MTNNVYVLINDLLLPADEASLMISDLSIQRGYGIFDFFKTVQGKPVFLDDHLDRFYYSASQMHLTVKKSRKDLKGLLYSLIRENNMPDSGIRITLTGGYSADGFNIADPNLIVIQQSFNINKDFAIKGIRLITYPYQRQLSHVKTLDYLMAIWLQPVIKENNVDDVLYHQNGIVAECPRANFFIVTADDCVVTPANNILKGITRKHVLKIAGELFVAEEREVSLEDIKQAKEAFITSTTKNILPVVEIDGNILGDGKPGTFTQSLSRELESLVYR